jgi:hypothetical protein
MKIIYLLIFSSLTLSLTGCWNKENTEGDDKNKSIHIWSDKVKKLWEKTPKP